MAKKLILTIENSLKDFEKKGNLDFSLEYYNPNNYFDEVYFISYNPEDLEIKHAKKWLKIKVPKYFIFLKRIKNIKILLLIFGFFTYFIHVFYLFSLIKKHHIDIARTGHPYMMSFALWLASKMASIPFIPTIGGDNRLAQEKIGRYHILNNKYISYKIEEFILARSTCVIVPNEYTKNYVISISGQKEIKVIPLPLRKEIYEYSAKSSNAAAESNFFLFIGRFVGDKHPDFVLKTYAKLIAIHPEYNMKLIMIGDGEMYKELNNFVVDNNLQDKVIFTGFLQATDIIHYLQSKPICLIPVSGYVIYEAAIFENIIITSDIEWHSEFIDDGKNGWVAQYLDETDWIRKIENVLFDIKNAQSKAVLLKKKIMPPVDIYTKQIEMYKEVSDEK